MDKLIKYFLIPAAIFTIAFTFGLTPIQDFDVWWHIHLGGLILNDPSNLWRDTLSYTAYGAAYQNHSWLSSIILYLLYSCGGITCISILTAIITGAITFTAYKTLSARFPNRWGINLLLTFIIIWAISDRIDARPYVWSSLFVSIYFYIISHAKRDEKSAIWFLIPLQLIWANLHGGTILGIAIAWMVFLAGRKKRLFCVALGVTAATMATPYTYNTLLYPIMHSNFYYITHYTSEWLSPFSPILKDALSVRFFAVLLFLLPISFIVSWRRFSLERFLLAGFVTYLASTAHRFIAEFMLISVPVVAANIGSFKVRGHTLNSELSVCPRTSRERMFNIVAALAVFAICTNFLSRGVIKTFSGDDRIFVGIGTIPFYAPKDVVDFLNDNNIKGRMFNDMSAGGYLSLYRPSEKIFIDGRTPLYGDEFFGRYAAASLYPPVEFERFEKKYGFDYIVMLNYHAWGHGDFHAYLTDERPDWALVYYSPTGCVYVKNEPKFKNIINKYRIKKNPIVELMKISGRPPKLYHGEEMPKDLIFDDEMQ